MQGTWVQGTGRNVGQGQIKGEAQGQLVQLTIRILSLPALQDLLLRFKEGMRGLEGMQDTVPSSPAPRYPTGAGGRSGRWQHVGGKHRHWLPEAQ